MSEPNTNPDRMIEAAIAVFKDYANRLTIRADNLGKEILSFSGFNTREEARELVRALTVLCESLEESGDVRNMFTGLKYVDNSADRTISLEMKADIKGRILNRLTQFGLAVPPLS